MPSLSSLGQLIWFAHCPKAGGTSVEQFMVAQWGDQVQHLFWGWDVWWRSGGWRIADPPNSPQHLIWKDVPRQLPRMPDAVFTVVRDPVTRMQSEYRYQRQHRNGSRLGKLLALLPFAIWLRLMLKAAEINPYLSDNHFRAQSEFVPEGARAFHLENGLLPVARWLEETVGQSISGVSLPHALPGEGHERVRAADAALIAHVFAEDYRRFGYVKPSRPVKYGSWLDLLVSPLAPFVAWADRRGRL